MDAIIKKFFVVIILVLLVMSSQIVSAEDWSSIRNFSSKSDLARWIENGRRNGQTEFNFTLTNMNVTVDELTNEIANDGGSKLLPPDPNSINYYTYYVNELPGTRVANAYLSGDTSKLTAEEMKLYIEAIRIVMAAREYSYDAVERERYIHDEICKRSKPISIGDENRYYRDENEDYIRDKNGFKKLKPFATAIGVLNNGYNGEAICSGYSDAFYMLCRMCELDVVRIGGKNINSGNGHGWNAIKLNGAVYFVDVFWDDEGNSDEFFNKSAEFFRQEHAWNYVAF